MSIKLSVKDHVCIVPLRFERASKGVPDAQFPDIDNRGFQTQVPCIDGYPSANSSANSSAHSDNTAALSIMAGQTATIKLVRENIAPTAALFISASDTEVLTVTAPLEHTKCPDGPFALINIKANISETSQPQMTHIEVRFGKKDGPVIHRLAVYVLPSLVVNVQPYIVRIDGRNGLTGTPPSIDFQRAMSIAQSIWAGAGIVLSVAKPVALSTQLLQADLIACNKHLNEMNDVLNVKWQANCINLYLVQEIEGNTSYTINAQEYQYLKLNHPAIFFGLFNRQHDGQQENQCDTQRASDVHLCGNDLAHAIGQFFSLSTPLESDASKLDTWTLRSLMHSQNPINRVPPTKASWLSFNDFGYGVKSGVKSENQAYRGGLLPIKSITKDGTDAHCIAARNYILQGSRHIYS